MEVDGGNDLAMVLIEGIDKMSLEDVGDFIRSKTSKIRSSKGGDEAHKKRTGPAKFLPAFILSVLLKLMTFITSTCGIDMKMFGMKKDAFGVAMVTSVGMLGFTDASAPFTRRECVMQHSPTAPCWWPLTKSSKSQSQWARKSRLSG